MRLPRDLSGSELIKKLKRFGYDITRQSGSHIRLTTYREGEHHVTIPKHDPLKIGTLAAILDIVCAHFQLTRDELLQRLYN